MTLTACTNKDAKYDATGTFEATEVLISANATGTLMHLDIQEGQSLQAGQVVGVIDTTQLHLRKMQLLSSARTLGTRQTNIPVQVASLRAQIASQRSELERFTQLQKSGAATEKQVTDLRNQLTVLERQLAAQTDALSTSNRSLGDESSTIGIQVQQVEDQIAKSIITSPLKGTVLSKYAEPGELATTGRVLFKVANLQDIHLRAYVDADQLTGLKLGQPVRVWADSGKSGRREYKGTISWISDKAEFTPKTIQTRDERANLVYAIKVAVPNDGLIKSGMYGEVKF